MELNHGGDYDIHIVPCRESGVIKAAPRTFIGKVLRRALVENPGDDDATREHGG